MMDFETMQENDEAALIGFRGEPIPDSFLEDEMLSAAWRAGRTQAIDKGLIMPKPSNSRAWIKIKTDHTIRLNSQRIPECY